MLTNAFTQPTSELLLRRRGLCVLPVTGERNEDYRLEPLEQSLLGLGYMMDKPLQDALRCLPEAQLKKVATHLLLTLKTLRGDDAHHVPLFRKFPQGTPENTETLFFKRVVSYLFQTADQPCLTCGERGAVRPLRPCSHLVCQNCWDGENYSACPICNRRLTLDDPFVQDLAPYLKDAQTYDAPSRPLQLLRLCTDAEPVLAGELQALLRRTSPLNVQDREDLLLLLAEMDVTDVVLPEIPVREILGLVLGTILTQEPTRAQELLSHTQTATDVLRTVNVLMEGPEDLTAAPPNQTRSLRRPLRRAILARLECMDDYLFEDMLRHVGLWKAILRGLQPWETPERYPRVALATALVRRSNVMQETPLGELLRATLTQSEAPLELVGMHLQLRGWSSQVVSSLDSLNLETALRLLSQRPGELVRRLDHVLRIAQQTDSDISSLLELLETRLSRVASPLLLSAATQLRHRTQTLARRVFMPKGEISLTYSIDDTRAALHQNLVDPVVQRLEAELLRRSQVETRHRQVLIDAALADVQAPLLERQASKALVDVPRGSVLPMPEGDVLRCFLHWTESAGTRVDLDLSVAMYGANHQYLGLCDYTHLRFQGEAAVHSGDLTSAPAPLGATEFVDLDLTKLKSAGVRHLAVVVFSYNSIPFDNMQEAFAGVMERPQESHARRSPFHPGEVMQRFDLQGNAKVAIPLLVDLERGQLRWIDLRASARGSFHSVWSYRTQLGNLIRDLPLAFATRPTLWDVVTLQAAASAEEVLVRMGTHEFVRISRDGMDDQAFLQRIRNAEGTVCTTLKLKDVWDSFGWTALRDDDLPIGKQVPSYVLFRTQSRPAHLGGGDLVTRLDGVTTQERTDEPVLAMTAVV